PYAGHFSLHPFPTRRSSDLWFWVDDDGSAMPDWAVSYEEVVSKDVARQAAPWGRDGDDLYMLYTGGTTGMPKGTMWRQDDIFWLDRKSTRLNSSHQIISYAV